MAVKEKNLLNLPMNMNFRACDISTSSSSETSTRKLILLFGWMQAKNVHLEKYRKFWISRGFDILTVRTTTLDRMFPPKSIRRNVQGLLRFFREHKVVYDRILFHTFSVGTFVSFEFLRHLMKSVQYQATNSVISSQVLGSIKGVIMDSITFIDGSAVGTATSITDNCVGQFIIRQSVNIFQQITRPLTLSHYRMLEQMLYDNPKKLPGLFLFSNDDPISNPDLISNVVKHWKGNDGLLVRERCWEVSGHVQHYKFHPEEYGKEVDSFLGELDKIRTV